MSVENTTSDEVSNEVENTLRAVKEDNPSKPEVSDAASVPDHDKNEVTSSDNGSNLPIIDESVNNSGENENTPDSLAQLDNDKSENVVDSANGDSMNPGSSIEQGEISPQANENSEISSNLPSEVAVPETSNEKEARPVKDSAQKTPSQPNSASGNGSSGPKVERTRTLFVRNISFKTPPQEIHQLFESYGDIFRFFSMIDKRGMAFVSYYDLRDAEKAKNDLQNHIFHDRKLHIHYSLPRDEESRAKNCDKDKNQGTVLMTLKALNGKPSRSSLKWDEDMVKTIFSKYGDVKCVRSANWYVFFNHEISFKDLTPYREKSKYTRFIEFFDSRHANRAVDALHDQPLSSLGSSFIQSDIPDALSDARLDLKVVWDLPLRIREELANMGHMGGKKRMSDDQGSTASRYDQSRRSGPKNRRLDDDRNNSRRKGDGPRRRNDRMDMRSHQNQPINYSFQPSFQYPHQLQPHVPVSFREHYSRRTNFSLFQSPAQQAQQILSVLGSQNFHPQQFTQQLQMFAQQAQAPMNNFQQMPQQIPKHLSYQQQQQQPYGLYPNTRDFPHHFQSETQLNQTPQNFSDINFDLLKSSSDPVRRHKPESVPTVKNRRPSEPTSNQSSGTKVDQMKSLLQFLKGSSPKIDKSPSASSGGSTSAPSSYTSSGRASAATESKPANGNVNVNHLLSQLLQPSNQTKNQ